MQAGKVEPRRGHKMWMRILKINDIDVVDSIGLIRLTSGTTAYDHHFLILRGWQKNAGGLIAHAACLHTENRRRFHWILRKVDDAGIDLQFVIHATTVEEDAPIGEQK